MTKKLNIKSEFLKELADGAAKWREVAETATNRDDVTQANEQADAYEYMMHSFTAPEKKEIKQ